MTGYEIQVDDVTAGDDSSGEKIKVNNEKVVTQIRLWSSEQRVPGAVPGDKEGRGLLPHERLHGVLLEVDSAVPIDRLRPGEHRELEEFQDKG